jgi:hypothetical protein
VSARSLTLPQYIDLLRPEYDMYKLPFLPLPFWVGALCPCLNPKP